MAEEHQIVMKTNKGVKKVNMWLKQNSIFENNECLDNFLKDTQGLLIMYDAPNRYSY